MRQELGRVHECEIGTHKELQHGVPLQLRKAESIYAVFSTQEKDMLE